MVIEALKHAETEENWLNRQAADVSAAHSHGWITHFYDLKSSKQHESGQLNAQIKVTLPLYTFSTHGSICYICTRILNFDIFPSDPISLTSETISCHSNMHYSHERDSLYAFALLADVCPASTQVAAAVYLTRSTNQELYKPPSN
jgi:hypothetical protein